MVIEVSHCVAALAGVVAGGLLNYWAMKRLPATWTSEFIEAKIEAAREKRLRGAQDEFLQDLNSRGQIILKRRTGSS
jgi:hypothetical protein